MRYSFIGSLAVSIILPVTTLLLSPFGGTSAAAIISSAVKVLPTPVPKTAVKTKTVRELTYTDGEFDGKEVVMTDAEWKRILSPAEFNIMRQEGTEVPYTGELTNNHQHGIYYCAACGLAVFSSDTKFESGTGWPSFYQPIFRKNVVEKIDKSLAEERTEVECARCHAHLGHVFDDGPQPTGLRYCMNSVALRFVKK